MRLRQRLGSTWVHRFAGLAGGFVTDALDALSDEDMVNYQRSFDAAGRGRCSVLSCRRV